MQRETDVYESAGNRLNTWNGKNRSRRLNWSCTTPDRRTCINWVRKFPYVWAWREIIFGLSLRLFALSKSMIHDRRNQLDRFRMTFSGRHLELVAPGHDGRGKVHYDAIVAFSQTDFTKDLKKIPVPVLVMHGDDDQIVPYADSAPLSAKLLKNSTLKTYRVFRTACRRPRA